MMQKKIVTKRKISSNDGMSTTHVPKRTKIINIKYLDSKFTDKNKDSKSK